MNYIRKAMIKRNIFDTRQYIVYFIRRYAQKNCDTPSLHTKDSNYSGGEYSPCTAEA